MSQAVTRSDTAQEAGTFRQQLERTSRQHQHWSGPFAAKRIHLVGIGGCGMSSLGGVLLRCGAVVSGSDLAAFAGAERLEEMGAVIRAGHAPINVSSDTDCVVFSAAIPDTNPELVEARRRGITCMKYAEMLGQVMKLRNGVAISGTHGKSTTTAMVSYILRQAKADPTFVVGARVNQLDGSSGVGDGSEFVVEACEYDRSFLNLFPKRAAVLNIEEDHLDCFKNLEDITDAFAEFLAKVPADGVIIANGEDPNVAVASRDVAAPIETFGESENMTWRATNVTHDRGHYRFDVSYQGSHFLHAELSNLPGRHQVANTLAATALVHHAGVKADAIVDALSTFSGADRRLTKRGVVREITLLDDYGHHPTEIQVTLRAVRDHYPDRRLWVVFQPHQHSRTRFLLHDFARSFGLADHLLVPEIYFVRDSQAMRDEISSQNLVERVRANGGDALHLPEPDQIVEHIIARAEPGDVVLTMGAGDVWKIADELVRRLA